MSFNKQQLNKLRAPHFLIALTFVFTIIVIAMGQLARWDLLDQLSMVDNYFNEGLFYPGFNDLNPHGTSIYFPGVALLLSVFRGLGIDFYIVEFSIMVSCITVLAFMVAQLKIAEKIIGRRISYTRFIPFIIAYSLILTPYWLMYAVEFKPDTIALLVGYFGLCICGFIANSSSITSILIGALLCGGALLFKQQYIAFVFGISLYCLFFPSRNRLLFVFFVAIVTSSILIIAFKNADIWFWNVLVISDDGFLTIKEIVRHNLGTINVVVFSLICCSIFLKLNDKNKSIIIDVGMFQRLYKMPWIWGITFFILACLVSTLKNGGNQGNSQLAIFLIAPLAYAVLSNLPTRVFTGLAVAALLTTIPNNIFSGVVSFHHANELRAFVISDDETPLTVVTGSNVYFASRHYDFNSKSFNYMTFNLGKNGDVENALGIMLPNISPDRLVVGNWGSNKKAISLDDRYIVTFENQLGIVAKRVR